MINTKKSTAPFPCETCRFLFISSRREVVNTASGHVFPTIARIPLLTLVGVPSRISVTAVILALISAHIHISWIKSQQSIKNLLLLNAIYLVFIFVHQTKAKLFTYLSVVLFQKVTYIYAVILTTFKDLSSKGAELTGLEFQRSYSGPILWELQSPEP